MMYHVVSKTDTVEKLSKRYKIPVCMIIRANLGAYEDLLVPGRRLNIPPPFYCRQMAQEAAQGLSEAVFTVKNYIIKDGDTILSIAQRFSTAPSRVLSINGICKMDAFYPGREIRVPCPKEGFAVYSLKPGEELTAVAARFGMDIRELEGCNAVFDGTYPGMQLIVRAKGRPGK